MGSFSNKVLSRRECYHLGFPGGSVVKNLPVMAGDTGNMGSVSSAGKIPCRRKRQLAPVFLPEESHGQRRLVGYSPRHHKELDRTWRLSMYAC